VRSKRAPPVFILPVRFCPTSGQISSSVDSGKTRRTRRQRETDQPEELDGCNGNREGVMAAKVVVALLNEEQEFQQVQAEDARAVGARLGLEVEVHFAQGHAVVQIQQLFKHIHADAGARPLALVVEPAAGEVLERVARNAGKAGVGWILINSRSPYLDALRQEHKQLPIGMVGSDQREVGRIQARQVARLAGARARVLCVQGPAESGTTQERHAGLKETLGQGSELRTLNGDWTEAGAERAVAAWLRLKTAEAFRPDVVASQNDSMAVGAKKALVKQHPDWRTVPFLGCDGLPQGGQKLVGLGELAATIVTPSNTGPALQLLQRFVADGSPLPKELLLSPSSFPPIEALKPRA
jgi:ABC-type sugar transport system substrate-binding protein